MLAFKMKETIPLNKEKIQILQVNVKYFYFMLVIYAIRKFRKSNEALNYQPIHRQWIE